MKEKLVKEITELLLKGELTIRDAVNSIKKHCKETGDSPQKIIESNFSGLLSKATYHRHLASIRAERVLGLEPGSIPNELSALITPKKVDEEQLPSIWESACNGKSLPSKKDLIESIERHEHVELFTKLIHNKGFLRRYFSRLNREEAQTIKKIVTNMKSKKK